MSTSQLFTLRHKIQKCSFDQFQRYVHEQRRKLDSLEISNLFLHVYTHKQLKQMLQYLNFFVEYDRNLWHIETNKGRRLLQDLCYYSRTQHVREVLRLIVDKNVPLKLYTLNKLVSQAIEGEAKQEHIANLIQELVGYRKFFPDFQEYLQKKENFLCLKALKNDMLFVAVEILKLGVGVLTPENEELFCFPNKMGKKDMKLFQTFLRLYFEKSRSNPHIKDTHGRLFYEKMSKDFQQIAEQVMNSQQSRQQQRQVVRRSQNKVRSSMGQGQNLRQYNSQALHENSRQKMVINIQNSEDQLSIQRQANKIYENIVDEKQKYFKYQKKQKREGEKQKRGGIMKSQELRYYLEEDIKFQVNAIKQENRQYKCHFEDLIHKLKQKLMTPLDINLEVFGSFRTQLCLQQSDIDIAVTSANKQFQLNPLKLLGQIDYILQQQQMREYIQSVKFIKTATVPIIKVTCSQKYWQKKIDFTYQNISHNGLQSVELIREYLLQYRQLESLIFVLKKFIYMSNLSAPYLGGISSYGLILMIVAFIQQEYKNHDGEGDRLLIGDLLIGFLKFYGFRMNYVMKSINIFDKNKMNWQNYTSCLSRYNDPNGMIDFTPKLVIIDPLNDNNNVGRATHKIKQIQMSFEIAYISIHTFRTCGKRRNCPSYRNISKINLSDTKYNQNSRPCCLLKRMFRCTQKFIEM